MTPAEENPTDAPENSEATPLPASEGIPEASGKGIERHTIRELVDRDDPVILEIGCNDGDHTRWFLEEFGNPEIHCFEPDPRAIRRFKANIGDNEHLTLHELALSDRNGTVTFHQSGGLPGPRPDREEGWDMSGSILEPHKHKELHPWCTFESTIEVETLTLDTFMARAGIDRVDFIWMDVQGAEFQVLNGARNTLGKVRYLYTEYSNTELYKGQKDLPTLVAFLDGFRIEHRYEGDVLFANRSLSDMTITETGTGTS